MSSHFSKDNVLFVRASPKLKRAVRVRAAELGTTMELVSIAALCEFLGLPEEMPL